MQLAPVRLLESHRSVGVRRIEELELGLELLVAPVEFGQVLLDVIREVARRLLVVHIEVHALMHHFALHLGQLDLALQKHLQDASSVLSLLLTQQLIHHFFASQLFSLDLAPASLLFFLLLQPASNSCKPQPFLFTLEINFVGLTLFVVDG